MASFVGRVAELHQLDANLRAARAGEFRLALITGEAGIGKTRLVSEFVEHTPDVLVISGACLPLEGAPVPYAPVIDAIHGLVHSLSPPELERLLGPARDELARLVPELGLAEIALAPAEPAGGSRRRLLELLLGVVERAAANGAAVVAIEDVQWADAATRDLLRFLARGLRRAPVLMLLTVRTGDGRNSADNAGFVAELARLGSAVRIDVGRMDERDVQALATGFAGTEFPVDVIRRLHERSDGIPFVVEQLLMTEGQRVAMPPTVADTIRDRLGELTPDARNVLTAAAASGSQIDESLVVEVGGLDARVVAEGLRELVSGQVLEPIRERGRTRYRFRHALLRESVELELLPSDRRQLHRAAALALERRSGATEAAGRAAEIAYHWEAAEEPDRALLAHLEAGAAAERLLAWGTALDHYEAALAISRDNYGIVTATETDLAEILHRAADAAYAAGEYSIAIDRGRQAIANSTDDPARQGRLHERLRWYLWDAGDRRGAVAAVMEALRLIPNDPPSQARASVLGQHAAILMHGGQPEEALTVANEALAMAEVVRSGADIGQALGMIGWIQVVGGDVDDGLATVRQALAAAEASGDASGIALGTALVAYLLDWLGRPDDAKAVSLAGYERIAVLGLQRTYGATLLGDAVRAMIALGEWADADEWIARVLDVEATSQPSHRTAGSLPRVRRGLNEERSERPTHWLRINRASLLVKRGEWPDAMEELLAARVFESASGGTEYGDGLLAAEAELAAWRGDIDATRVAATQLFERPPGAPFGSSLAWAARYVLMAEADEAQEARAAADAASEDEARRSAQHVAAFVRARLDGQAHLFASPLWRALASVIELEASRAAGTATAGAWAAQNVAWMTARNPFESLYSRYREVEQLPMSPVLRSTRRTKLVTVIRDSDALAAAALTDRVKQLDVADRPSVVPAPTAVGRITVHALGRMRISRDGVTLAQLGGPKAGARQAEGIFAMLLDRGVRGLTKDEILELIWSETDLDAADMAFHRTLSGLRRTLQPDVADGSQTVVVFERGRYRLDASIIAWTDFGAFEMAVEAARSAPDAFAKASALEEARRLYLGEYFDDCPFFGDSAEVEPTRTRLRGEFVDALVMLGELAEERGDRHSAASLYRSAISSADRDAPAAEAGLERLRSLDRRLRVVASA